jgi:hypothetical protein
LWFDAAQLGALEGALRAPRPRGPHNTDYKEFEGRSHYTLGQPGWEEVADYALDWCNEHTGRGVLHYGATAGFD